MLASFHSIAQDTGASSAFTSDDPTVRQAMALVEQGKFSQADSILSNSAQDQAELREIIRRLRREYGQTEPQLLEKLRQRIPDVSADDLKRWREAGTVQHRIIDGQVWYFRREPVNLFRFCDEAKRRSVQQQTSPNDASAFNLNEHLRQVVAESQRTGSAMVVPRQHRVIFRLTVPAPSLQADKLLRMWLPFPQEYRQQSDVKLLRAELFSGETKLDVQPRLAPNAIDAAHVQHAQRTVYFEHRVREASQPVIAEIECEYLSRAYYASLREDAVKPLPSNWNGAYLGERLPHIAFSNPIKRQVAEIIGEETNPLVKARKIFRWIDANIRYHAEEEYGVLPSFALKCFERRKGDCGVQSVLFMTMCRIAGIPARWQSGWQTKPDGINMHDWCEIYIAPWGWLPCDVSYGIQKSDDPRIAEFYIGHQDSYRMIVNLDYGRQLDPAKQSLRSEPADFQRGEVEIDGQNLYFDKWEYKMRIFVDGVELK